VEKCEEGSGFWEKVPGVVHGTNHVIKDLEKGKKYNFRVKAQNMYGTSEPAVTDKATLAKDPYGKVYKKQKRIVESEIVIIQIYVDVVFIAVEVCKLCTWFLILSFFFRSS